MLLASVFGRLKEPKPCRPGGQPVCLLLPALGPALTGRMASSPTRDGRTYRMRTHAEAWVLLCSTVLPPQGGKVYMRSGQAPPVLMGCYALHDGSCYCKCRGAPVCSRALSCLGNRAAAPRSCPHLVSPPPQRVCVPRLPIENPS